MLMQLIAPCSGQPTRLRCAGAGPPMRQPLQLICAVLSGVVARLSPSTLTPMKLPSTAPPPVSDSSALGPRMTTPRISVSAFAKLSFALLMSILSWASMAPVLLLATDPAWVMPSISTRPAKLNCVSGPVVSVCGPAPGMAKTMRSRPAPSGRASASSSARRKEPAPPALVLLTTRSPLPAA